MSSQLFSVIKEYFTDIIYLQGCFCLCFVHGGARGCSEAYTRRLLLPKLTVIFTVSFNRRYNSVIIAGSNPAKVMGTFPCGYGMPETAHCKKIKKVTASRLFAAVTPLLQCQWQYTFRPADERIPCSGGKSQKLCFSFFLMFTQFCRRGICTDDCQTIILPQEVLLYENDY